MHVLLQFPAGNLKHPFRVMIRRRMYGVDKCDIACENSSGLQVPSSLRTAGLWDHGSNNIEGLSHFLFCSGFIIIYDIAKGWLIRIKLIP